MIGVTDARDEEVPKAFVAERTAPCQRVRLVEFIEAVPKSSSGNILRRELRAKGQGQGRLKGRYW